MSTTRLPKVVTCRGGTTRSRLAARVARELGTLGIAQPLDDPERDLRAGERAVALDGCSSACGFRTATARGVRLVAALNLEQLDVPADDDAADVSALAERVAGLLRRTHGADPPGRPDRPERGSAHATGGAHTVEDYLLALDRLTSPMVACGALVSDAPTLAAHVAAALGVTRVSAGEMLAKLDESGLVRRGAQKELLLTEAGRAAADTAMRRHRALEVFLVDELGFEPAECWERARRLRPAFDERAVGRLERALGFPERCPHGWPLDGAQAREESLRLRTLGSLPAGAVARVVWMQEDEEEAVELLTRMGIVPGAEVRVADAAADRLAVVVGKTTVVLDPPTSAAVLVRDD